MASNHRRAMESSGADAGAGVQDASSFNVKRGTRKVLGAVTRRSGGRAEESPAHLLFDAAVFGPQISCSLWRMLIIASS